MKTDKEIEVYYYIRNNYGHFETIIRALHEGFINEIDELKTQKTAVEVGFVSLLDRTKLKKLSESQEKCIEKAKQNCTFIPFVKAGKEK